MDIFFIGISTLLATTAVFFIVFFGLIWYWHLTKTTVTIVPLLFTFEVLFRGFIAVCIISLVLHYFPDLIRFLNL